MIHVFHKRTNGMIVIEEQPDDGEPIHAMELPPGEAIELAARIVAEAGALLKFLAK